MIRYVKDYLSFSRSEKNAIIILAFIIIAIIVLNFCLPLMLTADKKNITAVNLMEIKRIHSFLYDSAKKHESRNHFFESEKAEFVPKSLSDSKDDKIKLFEFDPNNISVEDLKKLRLPEKLISNICRYRQKGGKFYHSQEMRKIYGMSDMIFEKLEPYINIGINTKKEFSLQKNGYQKVFYEVEINSATEDDLDKIPSIGFSYANRIVKYRQLLGGYVRKEQLLEVYGLDSALFSKISNFVKVDDSKITKIPINLTDTKRLGRHPYIGYKIADKIIEYRNNKGPYKNIEEIKAVIGNELYYKVYPYLKLWD